MGDRLLTKPYSEARELYEERVYYNRGPRPEAYEQWRLFHLAYIARMDALHKERQLECKASQLRAQSAQPVTNPGYETGPG